MICFYTAENMLVAYLLQNWELLLFQVAALILENTFTSILDMAGVLLPFLKWFIGGAGSKGPKVLNCLVRSPWSTIDVIGQVCLQIAAHGFYTLTFYLCCMDISNKVWSVDPLWCI